MFNLNGCKFVFHIFWGSVNRVNTLKIGYFTFEYHVLLFISKHSRAVKLAEKLNLNFILKYFQNSNYILNYIL